MSAIVLLILLNGLRKSDKMLDLSSIYRFFAKSLIKINKTGARVLDSIYHMTLKYFKTHFGGEAVNGLPMFTQPL